MSVRAIKVFHSRLARPLYGRAVVRIQMQTSVDRGMNPTACLETRAAHGGSEGWSSGGCEGVFVTESSALARGRDCPETHASHGGCEGGSSGGCEVMFLTDIIRACAGAVLKGAKSRPARQIPSRQHTVGGHLRCGSSDRISTCPVREIVHSSRGGVCHVNAVDETSTSSPTASSAFRRTSRCHFWTVRWPPSPVSCGISILAMAPNTSITKWMRCWRSCAWRN